MHKNLILAAANQITVTKGDVEKELILVDSCHFGRNMQEVMKFLREIGCTVDAKGIGLPDRGQGFIDESSNFHYRSESYKIATASGQLFNDDYTLPDNKLDSSCIRHIPVESEKSLPDQIEINKIIGDFNYNG